MSFMGSLGNFLGSAGNALGNAASLPFDMINAYSAGIKNIPAQFAQRQASRQQVADFAQSIQDPNERMIFMLDPEQWAKDRGTGLQTVTMTGGDSRVGPSGPVFTAPKLVEDGGIYGTQTPTGYTQTGGRGPSIAENETAKSDAFKNAALGMPDGFRLALDDKGAPTGQWEVDPQAQDFLMRKAASGATRVNVPITLPAQNEFAKAFASDYASDLGKARDDANAAQRALETLTRVQDTVGKADTGVFAPVALQRDRVLSVFGNEGAQDRAAATQQLDSDMNSLVLPLVKQLGSSNSITDADRDFIGKVVGDKTLTPQAIKRIVDIQRRDAQAKIQKFKGMGAEALSTVAPAQGLPATAFGAGAGSPTGIPQSRAGVVKRYDAQGNLIK